VVIGNFEDRSVFYQIRRTKNCGRKEYKKHTPLNSPTESGSRRRRGRPKHTSTPTHSPTRLPFSKFSTTIPSSTSKRSPFSQLQTLATEIQTPTSFRTTRRSQISQIATPTTPKSPTQTTPTQTPTTRFSQFSQIAAPTTPTTPIQRKRKMSSPTDSSKRPKFDLHPPIEDPLINDTAEESWQPRKKQGQWTYFQANLLKKLSSEKVLEKIFVKSDKRVVQSMKLKNHLYDDIDKYFRPNQKFVVGSLKDQNILNLDFKTLQPEQALSSVCCAYVMKMLSLKRKNIQIEFNVTPLK